MTKKQFTYGSLAALIGALTLAAAPANAQSTRGFFADPAPQQQVIVQDDNQVMVAGEENEDAQLPANLQRQLVDFPTREPAGTIVVDTAHTYLYLVMGGGQAMRYGIGVGRQGFTWAGVNTVARKAEWPDWYPPAEMIARQPYLPRMTAGGPGNPLGARAMYIGSTEYRIHGTNDPSTIGKNVSSGCIRLTNDDVTDLYSRVQVGAKVVVLPANGTQTIEAKRTVPAPRQAQSAPLNLSSTVSTVRIN